MNADQQIRLFIGDLVIQNIALQAKVQELTPKAEKAADAAAKAAAEGGAQ